MRVVSGTVAGVDLIPGAGAGGRTLFYPPRWKLLLLAAASAFFALLGLGISRADVAWLSWIGRGLLVAFSVSTVVMLVRTLRPGPTVIFDADGFTDRTTLMPTGLVRWEEITVVRKREIGRGRGTERVLEVVLADPDRFYARPRPLLRRLDDRVRRLLKTPDVSIPGSMVSKPMRVVIEELQRWRPDLQVLELPPPLPKARVFNRRSQHPTRHHPEPPRW